MLDLTQPLFSRDTGRPVTITEAVPVRRYHVQFSSGGSAWMTEDEMERRLTNERPRFTFNMSLAGGGHLIVRGGGGAVEVKLRRKFGDFPVGQFLNREDTLALYENLGRWLADREPQPYATAAEEMARRGFDVNGGSST